MPEPRLDHIPAAPGYVIEGKAFRESEDRVLEKWPATAERRGPEKQQKGQCGKGEDHTGSYCHDLTRLTIVSHAGCVHGLE